MKAALRKRFGSLNAFQDARGLTGQQVRDLLRGKSNAAKAAVAAELGVAPDHLNITTEQVPVCGGHSKKFASTHDQTGRRRKAVRA